MTKSDAIVRENTPCNHRDICNCTKCIPHPMVNRSSADLGEEDAAGGRDNIGGTVCHFAI